MRMGENMSIDLRNPQSRAPLVLRAARDADIDAVLAIEQASFGDPWNRSAFLELLDDPRVAFLVADEGGDGARIRRRVVRAR